MERSNADVVIVGGGIAGAALGAVLAAHDLDVVVLERVTEYQDRVRGEYMQPWGVQELLRLGLADTLLAAGGGYATRFVSRDDDIDPGGPDAGLPLDRLIPGVPGGMCVGHPQACEALMQEASERGATTLRGVTGVDIRPGEQPSVRYEHDGAAHEVACRLVVGADGRQSSVRRTAGIPLHDVRSKAMLGGVLVRCTGLNSARADNGVHGDAYLLAFPRPNDLVRLYSSCEPGPISSDPDRGARIIESFQRSGLLGSADLDSAEVAGPCHFVPGTDAWTQRPFATGVVLVGDSAGWSDPISGQGLSVAMRDVRIVSDAILSSSRWDEGLFEAYGIERNERLRRLRISNHLLTEVRCTFTAEGRARRAAVRADQASNPLTLSAFAGCLVGPQDMPEEAFTDANIERILALA